MNRIIIIAIATFIVFISTYYASAEEIRASELVGASCISNTDEAFFSESDGTMIIMFGMHKIHDDILEALFYERSDIVIVDAGKKIVVQRVVGVIDKAPIVEAKYTDEQGDIIGYTYIRNNNWLCSIGRRV